MNYIDIIRNLDSKSNKARLKIITDWLDEHSIHYQKQYYQSGENVYVDIGINPKKIGVSSHFDRVHTSPGANDNSSAIVVCLAIIDRFIKLNISNISLRVFFFDEEEVGLKGSTAYVQKMGTSDLIGLINMELVGNGDMVALWPLNQEQHSPILNTFEDIAKLNRINVIRFDQIVTNSADHVPFIKNGLEDSFTITCISNEDLHIAEKYYEALTKRKSLQELHQIMSGAPLFRHYHQPTDTYEKINPKSLQRVIDLIQQTIEYIS